MKTPQSGRERLAREALEFKKAWLVCIGWIGEPAFKQVSSDDLEIPDYASWPRGLLQRHVADLKDEFAHIVVEIVTVRGSKHLARAAKWMARQFDRWKENDFDLLTVCNAFEFESDVGRLTAHTRLEVPPYAELLLQGRHGLAIRHPEYMLSRDLSLIYNLYLDAEDLLAAADWRAPPQWAKSGSENRQALARASIQTCFNLLESFISGVARGHLMTHSKLEKATELKLTDNNKPLKTRLISIPKAICGSNCGLDVNMYVGKIFRTRGHVY